MVDGEKFAEIASLICEPNRAKILWNLLDGKAYTASELATSVDISPTSISNHLSKLLEARLVKVVSQGRHRYYSYDRPEVAYVVESLANLNQESLAEKNVHEITGIKYCRTCYDHLAGKVSIQITEALEHNFLIKKSGKDFLISEAGWEWLKKLNITPDQLASKRRPIALQCLDWSERKHHIAGQLGAFLLQKMLTEDWMRKVSFSRELVVTSKGKKELYQLLGVIL